MNMILRSSYRELGRRFFAFTCYCLLTLNSGSAQTNSQEIVLVIPHTHWEGAVFKTREEYLEIGLPNILRALYLLKKYPDYRFVLDQMCYVKPFIERYPSEAAGFREFLSQGRLQIAGGTDTMHIPAAWRNMSSTVISRQSPRVSILPVRGYPFLFSTLWAGRARI